MDVLGEMPMHVNAHGHPPNDVCNNQIWSIKVAAEEGNIESMHALLKENPHILKTIDETPITDTPLHIAVKHAQATFVAEIAILMPSFARKLNQDGLSPMHLATSETDLPSKTLQMVKDLLKVDKGPCLLKGKNNRTPLYCAAVVGNMDILRELLKACPKSVEELTFDNENAKFANPGKQDSEVDKVGSVYWQRQTAGCIIGGSCSDCNSNLPDRSQPSGWFLAG